MVDDRYGTKMINGILMSIPAPYSEIDNKSANENPHFMMSNNTTHAITPATLDYAVKSGITKNTIALTEEEKTAAQEWLGITALFGNIQTAIDEIRAYANTLKGGEV
jgi:hypothetical protein